MLLECCIAHLLENSRAKASPSYGDNGASSKSVSNHSPCPDMFVPRCVRQPMLPKYPIKVRDLIALTLVASQPVTRKNYIYDKRKTFLRDEIKTIAIYVPS